MLVYMIVMDKCVPTTASAARHCRLFTNPRDAGGSHWVRGVLRPRSLTQRETGERLMCPSDRDRCCGGGMLKNILVVMLCACHAHARQGGGVRAG